MGHRADVKMNHRSSPAKAYDFLLKFLLVGDSDVGKGEILASLQDGSSESPYGYNMGKFWSLCTNKTSVSWSVHFWLNLLLWIVDYATFVSYTWLSTSKHLHHLLWTVSVMLSVDKVNKNRYTQKQGMCICSVYFKSFIYYSSKYTTYIKHQDHIAHLTPVCPALIYSSVVVVAISYSVFWKK